MSTSHFAPEGDSRITANIRTDLHKRLKIMAVHQKTTVGELIEQWIQSQDEPATMSISALNARLGLAVNSKLLASLGFEAAPVNNAKLYKESDFTAICQALVDHIDRVHREHAGMAK